MDKAHHARLHLHNKHARERHEMHAKHSGEHNVLAARHAQELEQAGASGDTAGPPMGPNGSEVAQAQTPPANPGPGLTPA